MATGFCSTKSISSSTFSLYPPSLSLSLSLKFYHLRFLPLPLLSLVITRWGLYRKTIDEQTNPRKKDTKTMTQENPEISSLNSSSTSSSSSLGQAIDDVSSLIALSHGIKVFPGKWALIRTKLEELNSGLVAIENCDSAQNPILSGLVSAVILTVNEAEHLAKRCSDVSYSGKLLMKSDLDMVASKFDFHARSLSKICTSGILTRGSAIVVSKPGFNACKDDMRFYVGDLLTRMKIGDADMKRQALVNLHEVVNEDERYAKVVFDVGGDFVGVLVNVLGSLELEVQEEAAKVVSLVCGFGWNKNVLVGAGVIGPLVRVLESGSGLGKEAAARSLVKLTENSDNAWSVSAHGGVTALLKCCSNGDPGGELVGPACGVLRNFVGVEEIKRFMIEEGAVSTFVKLLGSRDETVQISSIEFLQSIASGDESVRQSVIGEGGIRALVQILDPRNSSTSKGKEMALRAIETFCFSPPSCAGVLMNCGFMDKLLFFLRNGDVSVQESALKVAFRLSGGAEEVKKSMGDAGYMAEFARFLDAKSLDVREMAASALSNLVSLPRNRKRFVQDDRSVSYLLQLLDQEETNPGNKKPLLSILMSLTHSNSGRRKIATSGYLKNIEKLAEAEVSDAKRLVRKLSTSRFRSILGGIFHS